MFNHSLNEEHLTQSPVLNCLKTYLCEENRPRLQAKAVPDDIVEDLTILYRKWDRGDLSILARRGLIQRRPNGQYFPDPDWEHRQSADFFGHGHLVNGQTWGSRAEMTRDGAHGPLIAGIFGTIRHGARSVVMGLHDEENQNIYADVDQGNRIYYCGTANRREAGDDRPTNLKDAASFRPPHITGPSGDSTNATKAMLKSIETGRPVRVFRSSRLATIVEWRPHRGFRYDGLYVVKKSYLVNEDRQIYRFRMDRLDTGQGPIRESMPPPAPERRKRRHGQD
jgi:hypothetical protein